MLCVCSSLDLSELAKAAKKKLQSVSIFAEPLYEADLSLLLKCSFLTFMQLSNHLFEELAMDVYDEVDRRETDAGKMIPLCLATNPLLASVWSHSCYTILVWLATQNHSTLVTETTVVPFLPVNPEYSSTRNQARQRHSPIQTKQLLFPTARLL